MEVLIAIFLLMAMSGIAYIFYKRCRSLLVTYLYDQKEIAALRSTLDLNQQVPQSKLLLDLCYGADCRKEGIVKSTAFLKLEERLRCVSIMLIQAPVSIQLFYNLHKSEFSDAQKNSLHACQTASDNYFPSYWLQESPGTIVGTLDMSKTHPDDIRLLSTNKLGGVLQSVRVSGNDKPPMIAFGTITFSIEELHQSYSAAVELLNHKIHNHLTVPYRHEEFQRSEAQFDYSKQQSPSRYTRLGKSPEAEDFLKPYFSIIYANPNTSVASVKETASQIINVIIETTKDMPAIYADCVKL